MSWRLHAAALVAGAAAVLGFSPFDAVPVLLAALAVLVHLWMRAASPGAAFAAGYLFGLGFFLAGVSWIYVSLHRFGGMPAPLAAVATFGFCAFLALFPALAGWVQARLAPQALRPLRSQPRGRSPNGCAARSGPGFPGLRPAVQERFELVTEDFTMKIVRYTGSFKL